MDIPAFINELLAQQGVLIVPGLGTFSSTRVEGYYNKDQQHFYPPTQQIQFKTEQSDDDVLANLIAEERQISIASAKYFIEKFVTNILEQASAGSAPLGSLGTFSTRRGSLIFTPSELNETDETFYGLAPVRLKRNSSFRQPAAIVAPPKPVELTPPPPPEPPVVPAPQPEPEPVEEEYIEEEETERTRISVWLVLAIIIVVLGIGIIGAYIYKPALFSRIKPMMHKTVQPVQKLSTADSLKRAQQAQKDIGIAPGVNKADSTPVDTFRIAIHSWKTFNKAKADADDLNQKDIKAEVHKMGEKTFQVTTGNYINNDSAKAALPIIRQKLKNSTIHIQLYPFKKQ